MHNLYYHLVKQALHEAKQSMWNATDCSRCPTFKVGQNVLLSIHNTLHHPSLRNKFTKRWISPRRVLELTGSAAARIQLALHIHNVLHVSVLKPYQDSFAQQSEPNPTLPQQTALTPMFEVECITNYG